MILLINDDGVDSPGMRALYNSLRRTTGEPVLAVAPASERSGQAHAITLNRALTINARHEPGFFAFVIDGTPTDCVKLALTTLMHEPPSLVVSGVNDGPNVGRSIFYSGTVGAAMEAAVEGHRALAISRQRGPGEFEDAANLAAAWAQRIAGREGFIGKVLNINCPATPASSWREPRIAAHGRAGFKEGYKPQREGQDRVGWKLHGEWSLERAAHDGGHAMPARSPPAIRC